jgi:hypothetical protein
MVPPIRHAASREEELPMKKLLLMIGITGVLGLVNAGTRAQAATSEPTTPSAPGEMCSIEDAQHCNDGCKEAGCFAGICFPPCECINQNGSRCTL